MEILQQIYAVLIAAIPSLTAIVSTIVVAIKLFSGFKDLTKKTDTTELKVVLKQVIKENEELKTQIKHTLSKIDKIAEEDVKL